jgi:sensor c-di-GMP phosphodiesterase-like protein
LDFRDQALELADNKCYRCGSKVNDKTAMFDYKVKTGADSDRTIENISVLCPKCSLMNVEKLFSTLTNPVVESAAKLWIHSYLKSPVITGVFSVLISLIASFLVYETSNNLSSNKTQVNLDFKSQIAQLDDTEESLKTLLKFVNKQRETTTLNEQRIQQLELEKLELEPLVNADKATVEALFQAQEQRALANSTKERWFGFGLGIIASIIASIVMVVGKYFIMTRRKHS